MTFNTQEDSNLALANDKLNVWLNNLDSGFVSIDSSSFSNISCPRKALLSYVMKFAPAGGRSPLVFGHMLHELLEWQLKNGSLDIQTFKQKAKEIVEAKAQDSNQTNGEKLNSCFDDRRNTEVFMNLVEAYAFNIKAKGERYKPLELNGEKMVEKSFSIPIGQFNLNGKTITILWEGKLDALVFDTMTNDRCVMDHKTTSILGDKFLDDKMRGVQFHGYLFAANDMLRSEQHPPIQTVCLNVICSKKTGFEFQNMSFKRHPEQVKEWREDTVEILSHKITQLYNHIKHGTKLPADRNHCCPKFGKCEFFQVCEMPLNARQQILNSPHFYQISNWSPLND